MARTVNISLPKISDLVLQVKLNGEWQTVEALVSNLGPSMQIGYDRAVDKFSRNLLAIVKKSLTLGIPPMGGGVTWQPLSPATIERWGQHPIYNLTGLYSRSVGLYRYKSRVLIGLPIGTRRSSQKGLTLNQLARILEFGSNDGRIPSRPVWSPSLKAVGGKNRLKQLILTEIRRELQKYGVRPNQVKW